MNQAAARPRARRWLAGLFMLAGLLYPFAVYFGIEHLTPRHFALILALLWVGRSLLVPTAPATRLLTIGALVFCALLAMLDEPALLRWYPVLVSLVMLACFGATLIVGPPLIERLARLREPDLPEHAVRYTRRVTQVWVGFFLFNASLAAALTLWAPLSWWTLYNGLIAYLLMGLLFAGELLVRRRVRMTS